MAEEYDIILDAKKRVNEPNNKAYKQAKAASEAGRLKLISEHILQPYGGYGFELDKGQVVRYELISGSQIIDTFYMVRSRPMDELAFCRKSGSDTWGRSLLHHRCQDADGYDDRHQDACPDTRCDLKSEPPNSCCQEMHPR